VDTLFGQNSDALTVFCCSKTPDFLCSGALQTNVQTCGAMQVKRRAEPCHPPRKEGPVGAWSRWESRRAYQVLLELQRCVPGRARRG